MTVKAKNQQVLDYIRDRLSEKTSPGRCVLHLAPGGEIRKIEWQSTDHVDDILDRGGLQT